MKINRKNYILLSQRNANLYCQVNKKIIIRSKIKKIVKLKFFI